MGCTVSSEVDNLPDLSYSVGQQLGQGSFGEVREATHKKTNQLYALKIVDLRQDDDTLNVNRRLAKTVDNEGALLRKVQGSVHCVKLFESFRSQGVHYIVMEKCGDSLEHRLPDIPALGCAEVSRIFREMTLGVSHIHSRRIVHRDVKPANFLLGGPECQTLKLCDFGVAAELPEKGLLRGPRGTLPFMSPELLADSVGHDRKTDVWSLGATMYTALFGCYPYQPPIESTEDRMIQAILAGVPAPTFSPQSSPGLPRHLGDFPDDAVPFVRLLLERDAYRRCSAELALRSPFVSQRAESSC